MTFDIVYLLFGIFIILAAILAAILAYPGPKHPSQKHRGHAA
jgi:hypothetical protein